jgi:predicted nucleic acid-binding Zn ribbon protein
VDKIADLSGEQDNTVASPRDLAHEALAAARRSTIGNGTGIGAFARRRKQKKNHERGDRKTWSGAAADERDPQVLGTIANTVFAERGWKQPLTEARIFTDWAGLVGADIASHCVPVSLRDGELRLSAQSTAWATQIRLMGPALLARLATDLGATVVKRLTVTGPSGPSWKHGFRAIPNARGPRDTYG